MNESSPAYPRRWWALGALALAARLDAVVKLLNGNRYEHFAPTSETVFVEGRRLQIFVWSGYTKVAE